MVVAIGEGGARHCAGVVGEGRVVGKKPVGSLEVAWRVAGRA